MSDELTHAKPSAPTTTATAEKPADAWGQPISAERQAELQGYLDRWQAETDHSDRKGPFDKGRGHFGVMLTGADVSWLVKQSGRDRFDRVPNLHLEGANLGLAHLEGAILREAHMETADLFAAHLEEAILSAHLEGATLRHVHLEGADLRYAHLEGADLTASSLSYKTHLTGATLDAATRLGDIQWAGVGAINLTQIDWRTVPRLGDEQGVGLRSKIQDHERVVRAYRQLAAQLRAQGMTEVADRFAERAQVRQRKLLFRQLLADWRRPWRLPGDLLRWLFSWFLALLAGYGYHPGRSVLWYLATIAGFAVLYMRFGVVYGHAFNSVEAAVFSLTSFHGRGFFPGGLRLDDPVTVLAAIEAVIGLLIEISFIATFTQRFFGSK